MALSSGPPGRTVARCSFRPAKRLGLLERRLRGAAAREGEEDDEDEEEGKSARKPVRSHALDRNTSKRSSRAGQRPADKV